MIFGVAISLRALLGQNHGLYGSVTACFALGYTAIALRDWRHAANFAHMYYVLLVPGIDRRMLLEKFERKGISAVSHYVSLHSSPAGQRYGRTHGDLPVTNSSSERVVGLPLWIGITEDQQETVVGVLQEHVRQR